MYRRRFGYRGARAPVNPFLITTPVQKAAKPCAACNQPMAAGETVTRVRLKKKFRTATCQHCGQLPAAAKRFHTACVPQDLNKAMGYSPAQASTAPPPPSRAAGVAPPPRPPSAKELQYAALVAVETALKRRLAENPALQKNVELEQCLSVYQKCKQLALRPGTDAEGETALKKAIKRAIDLVL